MAKKKKLETSIYIGKSLPGLSQFTVFKDGILPAHVVDMASKNISIAGLIVPLNELQEARKNMLVKGHILHKYYTNLAKKEG